MAHGQWSLRGCEHLYTLEGAYFAWAGLRWLADVGLPTPSKLRPCPKHFIFFSFLPLTSTNVGCYQQVEGADKNESEEPGIIMEGFNWKFITSASNFGIFFSLLSKIWNRNMVFYGHSDFMIFFNQNIHFMLKFEVSIERIFFPVSVSVKNIGKKKKN